MKALNTDQLLDYLIEDNQASKHTHMFIERDSDEEIYFLNNIVLIETTLYFEENVRFGKSDTMKALRALEMNSQIQFENEEIVSEAIEQYSITRDSFSDCLKETINRSFLRKNGSMLKKCTT